MNAIKTFIEKHGFKRSPPVIKSKIQHLMKQSKEK